MFVSRVAFGGPRTEKSWEFIHWPVSLTHECVRARAWKLLVGASQAYCLSCQWRATVFYTHGRGHRGPRHRRSCSARSPIGRSPLPYNCPTPPLMRFVFVVPLCAPPQPPSSRKSRSASLPASLLFSVTEGICVLLLCFLFSNNSQTFLHMQDLFIWQG